MREFRKTVPRLWGWEWERKVGMKMWSLNVLLLLPGRRRIWIAWTIRPIKYSKTSTVWCQDWIRNGYVALIWFSWDTYFQDVPSWDPATIL
jgi:hypothetical protein